MAAACACGGGLLAAAGRTEVPIVPPCRRDSSLQQRGGWLYVHVVELSRAASVQLCNPYTVPAAQSCFWPLFSEAPSHLRCVPLSQPTEYTSQYPPNKLTRHRYR